MERCSAKPYEGQDKYIFVSYCHKDKCFVFPMIEQLVRDGYRVWYDEGIDPGSEWPEIIARHLNNCAVCIAIISENSLNSHNCRREINFALLKKKAFIAVVLEPVVMSLGMEMQLSATQSIFKYTLSTEEEFFHKLYSANFLSCCLGMPDTNITVSKPVTLKKPEFWLVRIRTNETIRLEGEDIKLGRSETMADCTISGNSVIGRVHARVIIKDSKCFLVDNNSKNKTFLNSIELEPEKEYALSDGDSIRLANENFIFQIKHAKGK